MTKAREKVLKIRQQRLTQVELKWLTQLLRHSDNLWTTKISIVDSKTQLAHAE